MRKLMLFFVVVLLSTACDPHLGDYHTGEWYIKNSTDQTLTVNMPNSFVTDRDIAPKDSIGIFFFRFSYKDNIRPYFNRWLEGGDFDKDASLKVYSMDNILLKEWSYSDKNLSGKQFFNENSWRDYEEIEKGEKIKIIWVFEIQPEDIALEPEP